MSTIRNVLKKVPVLGPALVGVKRVIWRQQFTNSASYWEDRYATGGNSGPGSYGALARFKAEYINRLVEEHDIRNIVEFGSGDGNQLTMAEYPSYVGYDVSDTALAFCRNKFADNNRYEFRNITEYNGETYDLSMSLDVIFHLVEDETFEHYMARLFKASHNYVLIFSSNFDEPNADTFGPHVRHRRFSSWIEQNVSEFKLFYAHKNANQYNGDYHSTSFCDFYLYKK